MTDDHHTRREKDLALLAAGGETGWWDDKGRPAPWPDDFLDEDSDWQLGGDIDSPPFTPAPANRPTRSHVQRWRRASQPAQV